jgi:hypothetical protein
MAMDPEQSSSQMTWSGLPAYSPPGRTAIFFYSPVSLAGNKACGFPPMQKERGKGMALVTDTHTKIENAGGW